MSSLREWAATALGKTRFTPDLLSLQRDYFRLPVFIYGTEKKGFADESYLKGADFLGFGCTLSASMVLYRCQGGALACRDPSDTTAAMLRGELYSATPAIIAELDRCNTQGLFTVRSNEYVVWYKPEDECKVHKTWFMSQCYTWIARPEMLSKFDSSSLHKLIPKEQSNGLCYTFKHRDFA